MPIASYNMPKELIFNQHSDNKPGFIRSCESKKSDAIPYGTGNLNKIIQFNNHSPKKEDSPIANREQP